MTKPHARSPFTDAFHSSHWTRSGPRYPQCERSNRSYFGILPPYRKYQHFSATSFNEIHWYRLETDRRGSASDALGSTGCPGKWFFSSRIDPKKSFCSRKVPAALPESSIIRYTIPWSDEDGLNKTVHAEYLQNFIETFYTRIIELIDRGVGQQKSLAANRWRSFQALFWLWKDTNTPFISLC